MAFFEWDESLDVGIESMNQQHHILIDLMDDVYTKNCANVSKTELLATIQTMSDYTVKHFRDEERFMMSLGFPGLEAHRRLHANLLNDLNLFIEKFKNSDHNTIGDEFSIFLKFWLSTHIRGIDTRYGVFAAQQKLAS
jgi:hemerythrin-like metal-binding protein